MSPQVTVVNTHFSTALLNLNRQRQESEFCDVILEVEGKQFPAHRCVLAACSEYFKKMFTVNMREKYEKKIKIEGTTSTTMTQVLDFVYSSQIALTDENVLQLLDAFSLMQIKDALGQVVKYMNTNLSVENCLFFRVLGRRHLLENLVNDADAYILNKFEKIIVQSAFYELNCHDLERLLQSDDLNVRHEQTVFEVLTKWIDRDQENRKQQFPWLFKHVRLHFVSQQYLRNIVRKHNLVRNFNDCRDLVEDAMLFHMNPADGHITQTRRKHVQKEANAILLLASSQANQKLYNTFTKEWIPKMVDDASAVKTGSAVAASQNNVVVCGGLNPNNTASNDCFRLTGDKWEKLSAMKNARTGTAAVIVQAYWPKVCDGEFPVLCVLGGESRPSSFPSKRRNQHVRKFVAIAEIYFPRENKWEVFEKNSSNLRSFAAAQFVEGRIYFMGGYSQTITDFNQFSQDVEATKTVDVYDLLENKWLKGSPMHEARSAFGSAAIGSIIYVVGGLASGNISNTMEVLDTRTTVWTLVTFSMNLTMLETSACAVHDQVYVVGKGNSYLLRYNPTTKKWINENQQVPSLGIIAPFFIE